MIPLIILLVFAPTAHASDDVDLSRFREILTMRMQKKRELRPQNENKNDNDNTIDWPEEMPSQSKENIWIVPPDPVNFSPRKASGSHTLADQPIADQGHDAFTDFDKYTDSRGQFYRPRSRSPFTKPGLWEPNPDNPHNRDHPNKYYYHPESVGVDWLNGQLQWGAHWAVPAAGVGGTDGMSTLHFPSLGSFLSIPDDYD